jgi:glycosyltransferase involved in cell wall biosynthesis
VHAGLNICAMSIIEKLVNIQYFTKPNSGPGQTRNYGVERAQGDYVLILDSDVVLPEGWSWV